MCQSFYARGHGHGGFGHWGYGRLKTSVTAPGCAQGSQLLGRDPSKRLAIHDYSSGSDPECGTSSLEFQAAPQSPTQKCRPRQAPSLNAAHIVKTATGKAARRRRQSCMMPELTTRVRSAGINRLTALFQTWIPKGITRNNRRKCTRVLGGSVCAALASIPDMADFVTATQKTPDKPVQIQLEVDTGFNELCAPLVGEMAVQELHRDVDDQVSLPRESDMEPENCEWVAKPDPVTQVALETGLLSTERALAEPPANSVSSAETVLENNVLPVAIHDPRIVTSKQCAAFDNCYYTIQARARFPYWISRSDSDGPCDFLLCPPSPTMDDDSEIIQEVTSLMQSLSLSVGSTSVVPPPWPVASAPPSSLATGPALASISMPISASIFDSTLGPTPLSSPRAHLQGAQEVQAPAPPITGDFVFGVTRSISPIFNPNFGPLSPPLSPLLPLQPSAFPPPLTLCTAPKIVFGVSKAPGSALDPNTDMPNFPFTFSSAKPAVRTNLASSLSL
ncbi:hypothetical protein HOO65_011292 [Ceratocystis lukuohia]|uniref:Uncharacterized protein n=1 Tax=Ceratocystis lukuohia TaxID=2019550 RepID=A0ABR4MUQ9_9PEZI